MFTYPIGRVCSLLGLPLSKELRASVDKYRYQPSRLLYRYVSWTFYNSFFEVFFSFLIIFMLLCLIFAVFLYATGKRKPECIVVSGEPFGTNPDTMFNDAFALSWMTFTTVVRLLLFHLKLLKLHFNFRIFIYPYLLSLLNLCFSR